MKWNKYLNRIIEILLKLMKFLKILDTISRNRSLFGGKSGVRMHLGYIGCGIIKWTMAPFSYLLTILSRVIYKVKTYTICYAAIYAKRTQ